MDIKKSILEADDIRKEAYPVPEWKVSLNLQTLTAAERIKAGQLATENPDAPWSVLLMIVGVRDEDGKPVFEASDIEALSAKNGEVLGRVGKKIEELSAMGVDGSAAEKKA